MKLTPLETRSYIITLDKYCRVKPNGELETSTEMRRRVIDHQQWLWERAKKAPLNSIELSELEFLFQSMKNGEQSAAGRTNWLGGTPISKEREVTQINCFYGDYETVYDAVDMFWTILNGCGYSPIVHQGITGFHNKINEIEVIHSTRSGRGNPKNKETFENGVWKIKVGDSAEAWAFAYGKLITHSYMGVNKLIIDLSEIRPAGIRLTRYGWLSNGDEQIAKNFKKIAEILNNNIDSYLSITDLMDLICLPCDTLANRRAAIMPIVNYCDDENLEALEFKNFKNTAKNPHRAVANITYAFDQKPNLDIIEHILEHGLQAEPIGFYNRQAARKRFPNAKGCNPCGEAITSICNLWELNLQKISQLLSDGKIDYVNTIIITAARANYRQTLMDLNDGILSQKWQLENAFIRACGLGITGLSGADISGKKLKELYDLVVQSMNEIAFELGTPTPKVHTVIKPSGTLSKSVFNGVSEGIHNPIARYLINYIKIDKNNPICQVLLDANYNSIDLGDSFVIGFPVFNEHGNFKADENGIELSSESILEQLNRYLYYLDVWTDQNNSCTMYYEEKDIPTIIGWLNKHWDNYIAISFLPKQICTDFEGKYPYLPQKAVSKFEFDKYIYSLSDIDSKLLNLRSELELTDCQGGACPVN